MNTRRSFFLALASLPCLGFLKSKPITMGVDVGKEVSTSTEPNKNLSHGITDHEEIQKEIEAVLRDYKCKLVHNFKDGHYILRGKDGPLGKEFNVERGIGEVTGRKSDDIL